MAAKPIELILLRQFVGRLPMPATLVDAAGNLVYVNPPTERLLGYDFADIGELPLSQLGELVDPRNPDRSPMEVERMPLAVALLERRPQQARMIVHDANGAPHPIVTTAIPLDGQGGVLLGAMSIFWEEPDGAAEQ